MPYVIRKKEDSSYISNVKKYWCDKPVFSLDINNARVFKSKRGALNSGYKIKKKNPLYDESKPFERGAIHTIFYLDELMDDIYEIVEVEIKEL